MSSPATREPHLAVALCIGTFRRPEGLKRALESLVEMEVPPRTDVSIHVVDNDPQGSARGIVAEVGGRSDVDVFYEIEPTRGISAVRNHLVACSDPSDAIVFLDDDEWVRPDWLVKVVDLFRSTGADVVQTPSDPVFESEPKAWIRRGGFFDRRGFATGAEFPPNYARTSGVLVRRWCFQRDDGSEPFDPFYALVGGEDLHFFQQAARAGAKFVWCDEARVWESVPASRARLGWILKRGYSTGNTRSLATLREDPRLVRRLKRIGGGAFTMLASPVRALLASPRGKAGVVGEIWRAFYGAGLIAGALGHGYREYSTVHGR